MSPKSSYSCPFCGNSNTQRNGTHPTNNAQKLICKDCGQHFRSRYQYHGWREGNARQVMQRLYEGDSVRSIANVLKVSPTTVQRRRQGLQKEFLLLMQECSARREVFKVKTPLRYPGGKAKVVDILLPYIPVDIKEYREPFIGGGSVFLAVRSLFAGKIGRYWMNDLQQDIAGFWQSVQQNADRLVQAVMTLRHNHNSGTKLYQHLIWNFDTTDLLERAARFFILNRITFSGVIEAGGYSESAFQHRFTQSSIQKLLTLTGLMQGVDITCGGYEQLLHAPGQNVFLYLDPPYLSATSSRLYGHKGKLHTAFNHAEFARHAHASVHRWLITYDDSPEIRQLFAFARIREYHCQYGMNNYRQATAQKGRELIITNF